MVSSLKFCATFAIAVSLQACTTITVTAPAAGATVAMPQAVVVKEDRGLDGAVQGQIKIQVDGQETEKFSNVTYSVPPGSTLCCLAPGPHSVTASGKTSSRSLTSASSFTVNGCPYCGVDACPTSSAQHPFLGVCCDNGACDIPNGSNFGAWRFPTATCTNSHANGCMNQNAQAICGATGAGCANLANMATQMVAVSATIVQGGALKQIQLPIGWRQGTNSFRVWITTDNAGRPGTVLEAFTLTTLRQQTLPVRSPWHLRSSANPNLASGATYWIVVGPGASDTVGSWNYSLDDAPAANSSNFLVNITPGTAGVPDIAGPWVPAGGLLRPAIQIDVR